jgi:hypothetical protein
MSDQCIVLPVQKCSVHGCEMEWVPYDPPLYGSDGYWFCQMCWEDEDYEILRGNE